MIDLSAYPVQFTPQACQALNTELALLPEELRLETQSVLVESLQAGADEFLSVATQDPVVKLQLADLSAMIAERPFFSRLNHSDILTLLHNDLRVAWQKILPRIESLKTQLPTTFQPTLNQMALEIQRSPYSIRPQFVQLQQQVEREAIQAAIAEKARLIKDGAYQEH